MSSNYLDTIESSLDGDNYNPNEESTRGAARAVNPREQLLSPHEINDNLFGNQKLDTKGAGIHNQTVARKEETEARSRGGAVWDARDKPSFADFFYKATSLYFSNGEKLHALVEQIYQFCDREYTVEIQKVNPTKGTFNLAVFVKEALIMIKLRLWKESDRIVLEIELRDGEPLAFGMVYRTLRTYFGRYDDKCDVSSDELDLSIDVLAAEGVEFPAPDEEEWSAILEECSCEKTQEDETISSFNIASSIESLSSIAQTYEPEDLEFLSKTIVEKKIGFVHDKYDIETLNGKYQQLWAMSALLNHLARSSNNCEHLRSLLPVIDNTIRESITKEDEVWFTVVNQLCFTYLTIVKSCTESNLELPNDLTKDIKIPADYAQKYNANMVEENKLISKSADAQNHLNEAWNIMITA